MTQNDTEIIDRNMDLCFSPDDNGWYFQEYLHDAECNTRVSRIYKAKSGALKAMRLNDIEWDRKEY